MGHNCFLQFFSTSPHLHLSLQDLSLDLDEEVCLTRDIHDSMCLSVDDWYPCMCTFLLSGFLVSSSHARSFTSTKVCMIQRHADYPVRRFAWSTGTPIIPSTKVFKCHVRTPHNTRVRPIMNEKIFSFFLY